MSDTTVTIPEELRKRLERHLEDRDEHAELASVVETALREYLERREIPDDSGYRPFRVTPARSGSGRTDVSVNHDEHLADATYDDAFNQS